MRSLIKVSTAALATAMILNIVPMNAQAATTAGILPTGGASSILVSKAIDAETAAFVATKSAQISASSGAFTSEEDYNLFLQNQKDNFRNLVIAKVHNYVNVRDIPSEDGEILGKLYDKSVGTYLGEEDGWYLISSGSVTGYVKADFCVTGEAAQELAKEVWTRIATVNTTTLKVRSEASIESSVIGLVPLGDQLIVSEEIDGWVQVDVEEGIGWVSSEFVDITTEFVTAESKAEEEARLAKEAEERKKAQAAAAAAAAKKKASSSGSSSSSTAAATTYTSSGSGTGQDVVDYALQFVGNPYVYGGSSLTNGTDCSGFVMSVYANFGVSLPHSSASDRTQGSAVEGGLDAAQPGDIICYSGHVAIYVGGGQIVHASTAKTGIIVSDASYKSILAIRRIF